MSVCSCLCGRVGMTWWWPAQVTDLAAVRDMAVRLSKGSKDYVLLSDATWSTPWLIRPLDLGYDLVLHSMTKVALRVVNCTPWSPKRRASVTTSDIAADSICGGDVAVMTWQYMGGHTDLLGGVVVGSKSKVGVKGDRLPLLESVRHR